MYGILNKSGPHRLICLKASHQGVALFVRLRRIRKCILVRVDATLLYLGSMTQGCTLKFQKPIPVPVCLSMPVELEVALNYFTSVVPTTIIILTMMIMY